MPWCLIKFVLGKHIVGGVQSSARAFHLQTVNFFTLLPCSITLERKESDYLSAILSLMKNNEYSVFLCLSRMIWWFYETPGVSFIKLCVGSLLKVYVRPKAKFCVRQKIFRFIKPCVRTPYAIFAL
jgi:hypothetical protein